MPKKIYKVVNEVGRGRYTSAIMSGFYYHSYFSLNYSTEKWTQAKENTLGVLCFDNLLEATRFKNGKVKRGIVWEVYYRGPICPVSHITTPAYAIHTGHDKPLWQARTRQDAVYYCNRFLRDFRFGGVAPKGTVSVKKIKLKTRARTNVTLPFSDITTGIKSPPPDDDTRYR